MSDQVGNPEDRFSHNEAHIIFVKVADWTPSGQELLIRLTVCSLCNLSICNFSNLPHFDKET